MQNNQKIVTTLPLPNLWTDVADLQSVRIQYLNKEQVSAMLKNGPVAFVVANVGEKPRWIEPDQCYTFWKTEVNPHLASYSDRIHLEDFPDEYAYIASEWSGDTTAPVILLEKIH
jgi:hypothetical protein